MMTSLPYPLSYLASCKFPFREVSWGCEKEGENPPSGHGGVHIWRQTLLVCTHLATAGVSSCSVPPAPPWACCGDCCHGRADTLVKTHDHVCSVYNVMRSCSRPLSTTIILVFLSHYNNKSIRFMRTLLSVLEKAATIGNGMWSFLAENLLVNFKTGSWDHEPDPQVT